MQNQESTQYNVIKKADKFSLYFFCPGHNSETVSVAIHKKSGLITIQNKSEIKDSKIKDVFEIFESKVRIEETLPDNFKGGKSSLKFVNGIGILTVEIGVEVDIIVESQD